MKHLFLIILISIFLVSGCGKKENETANKQNKPVEIEDSDTTAMSPEETFGAVMTQDILGDDSEVDLEAFLTEEIYPKVSKSNKVTIDKISSSLYLLKYTENNSEKNILIQKYYNPSTDEISFEYSETSLNAHKQFLK